MVTLINSSIQDEASFPPQCCKRPMSLNLLIPHLDHRSQLVLRAKYFEYGTPPMQRVYCPTSRCSSFLGPRSHAPTIHCKRCGTNVCTGCSSRVHPGENCEEVKGVKAVKELAQRENWKACPRCSMIVERISGCDHMYCRCGQEFCYDCGQPWKKCKC